MNTGNKLINRILRLILSIFILSSCFVQRDERKVRVLIVPKFEIGGMTGDFPGEAQLFYETYCPDCEESDVKHLPEDGHFYLNEKNGVGILVTGAGETNTGLSLMALLSDERYDFSDCYIVSVGCGGGSAGYAVPGDVILVTGACDYDLGHRVDSRERGKTDELVTWFPDDSFGDVSHRDFDEALCERVYELIRDYEPATTEKAVRIMKENFPDLDRYEPTVIKGTAISSDNYWKGIYGHENAIHIVEHYGMKDPYAVTEMEEMAVANVAECFGMTDRVISLRVVVNMDLFLKGQTPERLWGGTESFSEKVDEDNSETMDIFEPAMHNLLDAASMIIDAISEGGFHE